MTAYTYSAYGFVVRSELEIPELALVDHGVLPQRHTADPSRRPVDIVFGEVPERLEDEIRLADWIAYAGDRWLVTAPDIGRMLIEGGDRIVIELPGAAQENDMIAYVLGTGIATILLQRGLLPLHVSALLTPQGAIAFTGPSGAGKSTTAAMLNRELGWPIITDDVAVLFEEDGKAMLQAGVYRLRLWSDAMERLGLDTAGHKRDMYRFDKFIVQDRSCFADGMHPLKTLYEIVPDGPVEPVDVSGAERFQILMHAIHRPFIAARTLGLKGIQPQVARLCQNIRTVRGPRPDPAKIARLAEASAVRS